MVLWGHGHGIKCKRNMVKYTKLLDTFSQVAVRVENLLLAMHH